MTTKHSTIKSSTLPRLPTLFTAAVLSTGLLLSGCSDNDTAATEDADVSNNAEDTAAVEAPEDDVTNQVADANSEAEPIGDSAKEEIAIDNDNINPITAPTNQKSLVTNPTETGTPEDTVKKAIDSLYYGDAKKSASYYQVDMANFEEELANTQAAFQQTVDGVTITDTKYNDDKTRATITGELMLKGQDEPAPLAYELQKIDGAWKILG